MARGTVSNIIDRVELQLHSSMRHESNWLAANVAVADSVITVQDELTPTLRIGAVLSIGRELMRVRSVNAGSQEVTVMRGWRASETEAHVTDDEVLISPRFTRYSLYEHLVEEIAGWGDRLYHVSSYQTLTADDDETFELPANMADAIGVVELRQQPADYEENTAWPTMSFRLMRGTAGTWSNASTSGLVVRILPTVGRGRVASNVHALVALPFDVTTTELLESEDLVADRGLSPSMIEIIEIGMKMRVMGDAENARSSRRAQDEPRRAEEVPPGAALTVGQTLRQNYDRRFGEEQSKLHRKWKVRSW